jgi:hypothetical protein
VDPSTPSPDDKDWTWVLARPCPECGFDASTVSVRDVPVLARRAVAHLRAALERPDAAVRPEPGTWSPLEYACHSRDVCRIFSGRVQLMLEQDDPLFANWDQDATAVQERYWEQDPATVSTELAAAGEAVAQQFANVTPGQYTRPGRRSNGSVFTVETLGRYFVHDLVHHAHDVAGG